MFSLVKIYGKDLLVEQSEAFTYTIKSYGKVHGLLLCGEAEVSLVFDKDNIVFANSLEVENTKDVAPNKRALLFEQEVTEDFIKGSVKKTKTAGSVSVYLLIE